VRPLKAENGQFEGHRDGALQKHPASPGLAGGIYFTIQFKGWRLRHRLSLLEGLNDHYTQL
jgi:hypothetical protein